MGALIASTSRRKQTFNTGDGVAAERIWQVPVSEISSNPAQPRRYFSEPELQELAQSIKEHGIIQPPLVREKTDGGYELIAGERRWRAAQLAGLAVIPVIVKQLADAERLEVALIENIQREDLNAIEEAFAYKRLIEEFGLTQQQVGDKVGKSRPAVANTIRLLELPEEIKEALVKRVVTPSQARALLSIGGKKQQLEMLASMRGERITSRELERVVRNKGKNNGRRDPNLSYLEDELRQALGTKAYITARGENGTIVIEYYSRQELSGIIKKITGQ